MACFLSKMESVFLKFCGSTPFSISSIIVSGFSVLGLSDVKMAFVLNSEAI